MQRCCRLTILHMLYQELHSSGYSASVELQSLPQKLKN